MKQLFLTRHANANANSGQGTDFDRTISPVGEQELQHQGERLAALGMVWDDIIASPAMRTMTTAQTLAAYCRYDLDKITQKSAIYTAQPMELVRLLQALDDQHNTVMLVGHNPAISQLAGYLCQAVKESLPTCGIEYIALSVACWSQITYHCGQLQMSLHP